MANAKISALPSATTPLAGTETLPVVQSSTTRQVSVANLTAGRAVSMASGTVSSGNFDFSSTTQRITADFSSSTVNNRLMFQSNVTNGNSIVGVLPNGTATTSVFRVFNSSDTTNHSRGTLGITASAVFIDAAIGGTGSYLPITISTNNTEQVRIGTSGDVTLNTGNLIQGTAAKGVNFTANTPAAGMTSQLLNWYEEGTWTPTQGAGLTVVGSFSSSGTYTRVGRLVTIFGTLNGSTSIAAANDAIITSGYPFTLGSVAAGTATTSNTDGCVTYLTSGANSSMYANAALAAAGAIIVTASYYI